MLKRSSPRNCKKTFIIGWGFAECQSRKKWKWPHLLNCDEYFDTLLCKHWYWQVLAQEIANWHFFVRWGFAELQILKNWKWPYLLNCEEYWVEILNTHWYRQDVANEIVKGHLGLVKVLLRFEFWKKWNWPYLLNLLVYFDKILHTHYYWHDLDRGIAKSSPRDCKMTFNIGRGCAELQILKNWKWPNWVDFCDETLHTHWYWQDVAQEIVKCHLGLAEVQILEKTVKLALSLETFWMFW